MGQQLAVSENLQLLEESILTAELQRRLRAPIRPRKLDSISYLLCKTRFQIKLWKINALSERTTEHVQKVIRRISAASQGKLFTSHGPDVIVHCRTFGPNRTLIENEAPTLQNKQAIEGFKDGATGLVNLQFRHVRWRRGGKASK